MVKSRSEVAKEDTWNVESLYPNYESWEKEFILFANESKKERWPELLKYRGKLSESSSVLKEALETFFSKARQLEKLYTYIHLRHDEDITNDQHKVGYQRVLSAYHAFMEEMSWFEPELISLPEEKQNAYLSASELKEYQFHLEKIFRKKPHTLPPDQEALIARAGKSLHTVQKVFSAMNDADIHFGNAIDSEEKVHEISHGSYAVLMRKKDRTLRKSAFVQYHSAFFSFENTLAELLNGEVEKSVFLAKSRHFNSTLEAALFPNNIPESVYHSLIEAVHSKLPVLHKYMALRKQALGLESLHLYDMYVPLTPDVDITMEYKEAESAIIQSVAPLGNEYQQFLEDGLKNLRWVDKYENKNKRSGGYSNGCYDSMPYILMNYKNIIRDVFTLAHEAGHSMHSLFSRRYQPYHYADYPIFLAEVASTFNEELLTRTLLKHFTQKEHQAFLINQKLEDIRATLFRQTMFAEFELLIHQLVERGIPLTPGKLKEEYYNLNKKYFGPDVEVDEDIAIEWARIPHFYYNYYVYQYATGISAALSLADQVLEGGEKERKGYLTFLKSGCSHYPIKTLSLAGIDMTSPHPVLKTIDKFEQLMLQLEPLLSQKV
ncbi:MAG: oligoendopeptidase F [Chlamydiales bacterium]